MFGIFPLYLSFKKFTFEYSKIEPRNRNPVGSSDMIPGFVHSRVYTAMPYWKLINRSDIIEVFSILIMRSIDE